MNDDRLRAELRAAFFNKKPRGWGDQMITDILILITFAIAWLRFYITPRLNLPTIEGSYEAFAHLWVGGLFGAWLVKRERKLWLWLAVSVSLVELVVFIVQKVRVG